MSKIDITKIDDNHLANRIAWCKRNSPPSPWEVHGYEPKYGSGGYMAGVIEEEYDKWQDHIKAMEKEQQSRVQSGKEVSGGV